MNPRIPHSAKTPISRRQFGLGLAGLGVATAITPAWANTFDMDAALAPRIIGSPDASIHVAEYFSLSCGHCANFHANTYPRLKREWIDSGRIRWEYRDFPLDQPALFAHALARAVPEDGYEPMLDMLFAERPQWLGDSNIFDRLADIAKRAGIGRAAFDEIMGNRAYLEGIVAIAITGRDDWRINSTPSFIVNSSDTIRGNLPYDDFITALEAAAA